MHSQFDKHNVFGFFPGPKFAFKCGCEYTKC